MEAIVEGFVIAFSPANLFYCLAGVLIGTFVGALPGIGALAAVSMLLPLSFHLEPTSALIMLAGVYYGSEYGGSIASILLNLPGTPANAITCLDGYPMSKQGRAGVALFITTIGSFIGGTLGILLLMLATPTVVAVALAFGPAEYFAAMVLGLLAAGAVARGSSVKGLAMVVLGLMFGCVGTDINSGVMRFTLGFYELYDGVHIVILAMGLFGITEIIASIRPGTNAGRPHTISLRSMIPPREDMRRSWMPILRGTAIGSIFGPLPGTGPTLASFMSYALEKRVSRNPSKFGTGAIEGIASPEAANNAAVQTAFIPTLALGIPGSATMAVMLGALMIHGISPGPRLVTDHPDLFWAVTASFWIGNVLLLVINIPLINIWVRLLTVPYNTLYPVILCLICIGVYSLHYSVFDIILVLLVGAFGYLLRLLDFEPAPLLVGFVLGPLLEMYLRRALLLSHGDFLALFQRPISGALLALSAVLLVLVLGAKLRQAARLVRNTQ